MEKKNEENEKIAQLNVKITINKDLLRYSKEDRLKAE